MNIKTTRPRRRSARVIAIFVVAAVAGLVWAVWQMPPRAADSAAAPLPADAPKPAAPAGPARVSAGIAAPKASASSATAEQRRAARFADFQRQPFPATRQDQQFGWTSADGKNPDVIRKLAHNELEFERMAAENARILRRQLVYHRNPVAAQIQQARRAGQPLRQLVLPGLDGREVRFEITAADLRPSGEQGIFSGRVAGQPDSMVTFAFQGGREAFTILDPAQNLYLVGEPREPGELVVKQIDPATYTAGALCGNQ